MSFRVCLLLQRKSALINKETIRINIKEHSFICVHPNIQTCLSAAAYFEGCLNSQKCLGFHQCIPRGILRSLSKSHCVTEQPNHRLLQDIHLFPSARGLMAGELGIEVGNLFSLWQDLDPWWPLDYNHNWLFNFSHCFSRALWTIHSPSQPLQNMVGLMFGAVFWEGRKKGSSFLWQRNYLPDQCPNQSYSVEERRDVLYWRFSGCTLKGAEVLHALTWAQLRATDPVLAVGQSAFPHVVLQI